MKIRIFEKKIIGEFCEYLRMEEKSAATMEKYLRDVQVFFKFAEGKNVTKELVKAWKESLSAQEYSVRSINSMLASLNSLLDFLGWENCKVKSLKIQQQTYCPEEKELTKEEYFRLLSAAEKQPQLKLIMETICATGIRVSELQFFTIETVKNGKVEISCKNKIRTILIPGKLKKLLLDYAVRNNIKEGVIFLSRKNTPINRSTIWARMKKLCTAAGVEAEKVFPHNLRKLFARVFYQAEKDIAKLADVLGHSSINTTRIYIMTTGREHRRQLERMRLII